MRLRLDVLNDCSTSVIDPGCFVVSHALADSVKEFISFTGDLKKRLSLIRSTLALKKNQRAKLNQGKDLKRYIEFQLKGGNLHCVEVIHDSGSGRKELQRYSPTIFP